MASADPSRTLCVSVHDVAAATWPQCLRLIEAVRAVAQIPLTLLVVPRYHRLDDEGLEAFIAALKRHAAGGDELALHGYRHLDEAPPPREFREWVMRRFYTDGEGEFSALTPAEAQVRIQAGLDWCAGHGWHPRGFVAPAWLLGEGAWRALESFPFAYTATRTRLHLLPERIAIKSPVLAYSTRAAWRRGVSRFYTGALCRSLERSPTLRVALHPADAGYPEVVAHWQELIARLLQTRTAVTKVAVVEAARRAPVAAAGYA